MTLEKRIDVLPRPLPAVDASTARCRISTAASTSPWPDADLTMFTVTSQSKGAGTKTNIGLRVDESAEIASQGG